MCVEDPFSQIWFHIFLLSWLVERHILSYGCTPQKYISLYEYYNGGPKRKFQEGVGPQCYYHTNEVLECCKQLCGKVVTWMIALEYYFLVHWHFSELVM